LITLNETETLVFIENMDELFIKKIIVMATQGRLSALIGIELISECV